MLNPIAALRQLVFPSGSSRPAGTTSFQALLRRRDPPDPGASLAASACAGDPRFAPPYLAHPAVAPAPAPAALPPPPAALQELWPVLVRRAAWAWEGDARSACVRLELGAGALSGATVLLRYEEGRVRVTLDHPDRADLDAWRARIGSRLLAAGLVVSEVD